MNASTPSSASAAAHARIGVTYGLAAYVWWGLVMVVYFKWVRQIPPLELLAHRVVWSAVLLVGLMALRGHWATALAAIRSPRVFLTLIATMVLLACNWFTFLWAVIHENIVQASLGYFINPLVNVLLGCLFLGERLRRAQWLSVACAGFGVSVIAIEFGGTPVIALILAVTFGLYTLLRKTAPVDALVGLSLETLMLLPIATGYLIWLVSRGHMVFAHVSLGTDLLLLCAGMVTALPLLWFTHAARRLTLSTVGLMQYIAPSLQLLLGVVVYAEPFTRGHSVGFAFIWGGLALYSWDSVRTTRQAKPS